MCIFSFNKTAVAVFIHQGAAEQSIRPVALRIYLQKFFFVAYALKHFLVTINIFIKTY